MNQSNASSSSVPDSKTNIKKTTNNDSVRQLAVRQNSYNTNSNSTLLNQSEGLEALEEIQRLEETQSVVRQLSDIDKNRDIENLLQDEQKLEITHILHLLDRIKKEGLSGKNKHLDIRVSNSFKELYEKYYAPEKPTLSPQTETIRRSVLYLILNYLYDNVFSKQDNKTKELFLKKCEDIGYPLGEIEKRKEERPPIILVQHVEEKREEEKKEDKEEEKPNEFEQTFDEFEEFLNKYIFTEDNKTRNNAYLVTKPLAKQIFGYLNRLIELSEGNVRDWLQQLESYLRQYTLNERNFDNNLPIAVIPMVGYNEIREKLGKIKGRMRR